MNRRTIRVIFPALIIVAFILATVMPSAVYAKPSITSSEVALGTGGHIIEGVPYVSQEDPIYCNYASWVMVFQYWGVDTNLHEVIHHSGVGHSFAYLSDELVPIAGSILCQLFDTAEFMAYLYGLEFEYWYPGAEAGDLNGLGFTSLPLAMGQEPYKEVPQLSDSPTEEWEEYWERVKGYITDNIPVITSVDISRIPYYQELGFTAPGAHAIVVVGFDEQKVYYNDPFTALVTNPEDGTYAELDIDTFKVAVASTLGTKFLIEAFSGPSEPLPKKEAFEIAHERNMALMEGDPSAYDKILVDQGFLFGIQGLEELKADLDPDEFERIILEWKEQCEQYGIDFAMVLDVVLLQLQSNLSCESIGSEDASIYLRHNLRFSPILCLKHSVLLELVHKLYEWDSIYASALHYVMISYADDLPIAFIVAKPFLHKMESITNGIALMEKIMG